MLAPVLRTCAVIIRQKYCLVSHYSTGGQGWLVSDLLTGVGGGQCARLGCDGKWRSRKCNDVAGNEQIPARYPAAF